jgi:hypothetical protein
MGYKEVIVDGDPQCQLGELRDVFRVVVCRAGLEGDEIVQPYTFLCQVGSGEQKLHLQDASRRTRPPTVLN